MYDYIVVGAGFCGSVVARKLAEELDKKVLILEKRKQIAGNMYDYKDENGIMVQKYGPHTFVTDKPEIVDYISKYGDWREYYVNNVAEIDGQLIPSPFNFKAIEMMYPTEHAKELIHRLQEKFPNEERVPIFMLAESDDEMIREYAERMYIKDYIPYTCKQWGIPPEKLDRSVIARVKIVLSYETNYMQQKYQLMPMVSFTKFFTNLLDHPNITVKTCVDALDHLEMDLERNVVKFKDEDRIVPVIYTGPIDEMFDMCFGRLPYISLDIKNVTHNENYHQATPLIVYPQAEGYTRSSEYKYFYDQKVDGKTTVSFEYPMQYDPDAEIGNIPYYPVINDTNLNTYSQYRALADKFSNLYVCGRLGDYKYYNMDAAIERAFEVFDRIASRLVVKS